MKARTLSYAAVRALPLYPRRPAFVSGAAFGVGALLDVAGASVVGDPVSTVGALGLAGVTAWWSFREVLPAQTTAGSVARRGDREQRAQGVASLWDVAERASRADLRRRAHVLRPSLRDVPVRKRDPLAVGVLIARTGFGFRFGQEVWSSCEETTLRIGGPRCGKSVSLACHGLDAPGALITTSTKFDLAENVHQARQTRAVHIFNPIGYGNVPSTVRWSILVGCEDYSTAARRVTDLIPDAGSAEGERWDRMARMYMPLLLNAAAIDGRGVDSVQRWIKEIGLDSTMDRARREIVDILAVSPSGDGRIGLLNGFLAYPERTRGSVTGMMTPALAWMADEAARSIGAAPVETITLDIRRLIEESETLHIIGPSQVGGLMSPLTSALVAEIAHQARQIASEMPSGRLDPPLTMLLDEAAVSVRLPLDQWSADMGGRGVTMHMTVQSLSQLEDCWGSSGAGTLLGNTNTLLMYGGGKDGDELAKISLLCGERRMRVVGDDHGRDKKTDGERRGEFRWVPVLSVAQISNMPPGQAVILKRALGGVVVGNTPSVLDRKGWESIPLQATPGGLPERLTMADVEEEANVRE